MNDSHTTLQNLVYEAVSKLVRLGNQLKYQKDWGSPVSATQDDQVEGVNRLIGRIINADGGKSESRLNGNQLRLYTTYNSTMFTCWVCGAGDEEHYPSFVEDANAMLQELGVLESGR